MIIDEIVVTVPLPEFTTWVVFWPRTKGREVSAWVTVTVGSVVVWVVVVIIVVLAMVPIGWSNGVGRGVLLEVVLVLLEVAMEVLPVGEVVPLVVLVPGRPKTPVLSDGRLGRGAAAVVLFEV